MTVQLIFERDGILRFNEYLAYLTRGKMIVWWRRQSRIIIHFVIMIGVLLSDIRQI